MTTTADHLLNAWTSCVQSLRLWVMQLVAWLATVSGSREMRLMAREDLREIRSELRVLLVMRVGIELQAGRFRAPRRERRRKTPATNGFLPRRRFMRHALRGVQIRSLADARHMLDHIERYVTRVVRNLRRDVKERVLVFRVDGPVRVTRADIRISAPDT